MMESEGTPEAKSSPGRLAEVAGLFLKLGFTAFGGPAAHVAMMRDETVKRRGWVTDAYFLELWGAVNLIPGPSSTEMAIYLGFVRAGWRGLIVGGACFVVPAMLIVTALAWAYVHYGATPQASALLYGIKPVIIAIILQALAGLTRTAVKGWLLGLVVAASLGLYLLGVNPLVLLAAGGLLVMVVQNRARLRPGGSWLALPGLALPWVGALPGAFAGGAAAFSLLQLFLVFLKIGAVLYGSGYVLLAFLRNDFVVRLGWLTDQQLLDAVAVGQFTPGPVFTTATFIGYVLGGVPGALAATLGIFLPSFVLVWVVSALLPTLRRSPWAAAALQGVSAGALGLMAGVALTLGRAALVDPLTVVLAAGALALLLRTRINSAWLVAGGAVAGLLRAWLA